MMNFISKTISFINADFEYFLEVMDLTDSLHLDHKPQVCGPINRGPALVWFISFDYNLIFNRLLPRNEPITGFNLLHSKLEVTEKTTLENLYVEAERRLPYIERSLRMGDVTIINLSQKGIKVEFRAYERISVFWQWVEVLTSELERLGFLQIGNDPSRYKYIEDVKPQIKKPGRKPDKTYDLSYERISKGEDYESVYEWCCKDKNLDENDIFNRRNFDQAMRRRRTKQVTN